MFEKMKDPAIRAVRTFVQAFVAVLLASNVSSIGGFADPTVLDQAATAGVIALLSFVVNFLEDTTGATALK